MPNGNINRLTLRCHDIQYEEDVYQAPDIFAQPTYRSLPDHVDAVREALLSFENTVPEEWKEDLQDELAKFKDADLGPTWTHYPQDVDFISLQHNERNFQERSEEHITAHKNLKWFQEIAKRARQLFKEPEPEWSFFWRSEVFLLFNDEARKQSGFHPTLDAWSIYESVLWNEFESLLKPLPYVNRRTQPKPDLTYGFPVHDTSYDSPKGLTRDELFRALSLEVLGGLIPHGVSCVPTTGLRNWNKDPEKSILRGPDRSCFPWAVVEMKRHAASSHESIERCYCQAANAAAAALELQAQLFDNLGETSPKLPPVVAFICVGPIVKVWLAYQYQVTKFSKRSQRMICIWSTSVRLTWGVASLRSIILNMHMWASRILKPKIQACVYQVSRCLKPAAPPASLFVSTDSSDKRLWASGFGGQPATRSTSTNKLEKTQADIIDLTEAFGSSRLTDACERTKGHYQHFDSTGNLKESTKLFSGSAHVSTDKGLFGSLSHAKTNTGLFGSLSHAKTNTGLFGNLSHAKTNTGLFGSSSLISTDKGLFGSLSHANTNTGLFGSSSHAKANTGLFGGSSGYTSTNTGLFGGSAHTKTDKSPSGESARAKTGKGLFGGSPQHESPNRRPFGSNTKAGCAYEPRTDSKVDHDSDHDCMSKTPAATFEAKGRSHSLGTASVAFSSYKESNEHYQTITFQTPYQKYSLEELRLADYEKGQRHDESSVKEGDDDQSIKTDDLRSEEDSNFDPDDDTCDHSNPDDCSCSHSKSDPEDDSECDEDPESDTCDRDNNSDSDAFDWDSRTSNGDHWNKLDRESVMQALQSRPLSGERRVDWPLLNLITRGLCAKDRRQVRILADHFRNPNGTCSVPMELVIRLLTDGFEEVDRIN